MSRSDQYIGLTTAGFNFLKNFPDKEIIEKRTIKVCDQAFNPWSIEGTEIRTKDRIYREELQMEPWSSGPMYFLHIGVYTLKNKLIGHMFSWKEDRSLHNEFDSNKGTFNV